MTTFNAPEFKTAKSVKDAARDAAFSALIEGMAMAFGADAVTVIGNAEIAVCVGERILSDGTTGEVCVTIKPVAKDFDFRTTNSGKTFEPFERMTAGDEYEADKTEKERKAEEKAAAKARKKAADEAARAKKKAEREAAEAAKKGNAAE